MPQRERLTITVDLPVDMPAMIEELKSWGYSYVQIAQFCACTPDALRQCRSRRGGLRFDIGVRLISMHQRERETVQT